MSVTDSTEWGPDRAATSQALTITEVNSANEQLVRTHHPALKSHHVVYVSESPFGSPVWLVHGPDADIDAGGRPIHVYPMDNIHLMSFGILTPRSSWAEELLFRKSINPRKLLTAEQLDGIRSLFPRSVGVRVLVSGFLVVLFETFSDVQDVYLSNWLGEIAGLHTVYDVLDVRVSGSSSHSDLLISDSHGNHACPGFLGLKISLPDGIEAITTTTHSLVKRPHPPRIAQSFYNWVGNVKDTVWQIRHPLSPSPSPASPSSSGAMLGDGHGHQCPVGKDVLLHSQNRQVALSYARI